MKSPSGFGRQPNVSNKIKKNVVSEQAAQQPTIETGLIREAGIQAQNAGSFPAHPPESSLFLHFSLQSNVAGIAIVAFGSAAILAFEASPMGNVRAAALKPAWGAAPNPARDFIP